MAETKSKTPAWTVHKTTAVLVLADGTVIEGQGAGAIGTAEAEVCFNTAITGYQEILTDPSYAGQIVTFTFPHIGNVGANNEDVETLDMDRTGGVKGAIFKVPITNPANYRSDMHFNDWLKQRNIIALHSIDTRALTAHIRESGLANAVIAHDPEGKFDLDALKTRAANWAGLEGMDLVPEVTADAQNSWHEKPWVWDEGYGQNGAEQHHIVAMDFGVKRNILRLFAGLDCKVTVVPATTSAAAAPGAMTASGLRNNRCSAATDAAPRLHALAKPMLPNPRNTVSASCCAASASRRASSAGGLPLSTTTIRAMSGATSAASRQAKRRAPVR